MTLKDTRHKLVNLIARRAELWSDQDKNNYIYCRYYDELNRLSYETLVDIALSELDKQTNKSLSSDIEEVFCDCD
jgi:hypothetical protein